MEVILAIVIGVLYAAGVYLLLRRSIVKLILGLIFFSHATNLLVFLAGSLSKVSPPFVEEGRKVAQSTVADPLPQALVLTSLVIGFGITAFALVLIYRFYQSSGTVDFDQLKED
jgi:multicomponent Na+:H+ antiporter subunit C